MTIPNKYWKGGKDPNKRGTYLVIDENKKVMERCRSIATAKQLAAELKSSMPWVEFKAIKKEELEE